MCHCHVGLGPKLILLVSSGTYKASSIVGLTYSYAFCQAYAEQEERRQAEERKQEEAQALIRWYQLLCSIVTTQRLKDSYKAPSSEHGPEGPSQDVSPQKGTRESRSSETKTRSSRLQADRPFDSPFPVHDHEHEYPEEDQSFDEETFVRTKRCPCGFSIQVEEL